MTWILETAKISPKMSMWQWRMYFDFNILIRFRLLYRTWGSGLTFKIQPGMFHLGRMLKWKSRNVCDHNFFSEGSAVSSPAPEHKHDGGRSTCWGRWQCVYYPPLCGGDETDECDECEPAPSLTPLLHSLQRGGTLVSLYWMGWLVGWLVGKSKIAEKYENFEIFLTIFVS